jgi:hypothetical protein
MSRKPRLDWSQALYEQSQKCPARRAPARILTPARCAGLPLYRRFSPFSTGWGRGCHAEGVTGDGDPALIHLDHF